MFEMWYCVRLVPLLWILDALMAEEPCSALGENWHCLEDRCFFISPLGNKTNFREANVHTCPSLVDEGQLAIPNPYEILVDLHHMMNDSQFRWLGMQPISGYNNETTIKWLDNSSAQEVFDTVDKNSAIVPTSSAPICLAIGNSKASVSRCSDKLGYICESAIPGHRTTTEIPRTSSMRFITTRILESQSATEVTSRNTSAGKDAAVEAGHTSRTNTVLGIPLWVLLVPVALAALIVVCGTVFACLYWKKRNQSSAKDYVTEMPPVLGDTGVALRVPETPQPGNPLLGPDKNTGQNHMYAMTGGGDYEEVQTGNHDVTLSRNETRLSRVKPQDEDADKKSTHDISGSNITGDVYAEVDMSKKHTLGVGGFLSEDEYSTTLVENTLYS